MSYTITAEDAATLLGQPVTRHGARVESVAFNLDRRRYLIELGDDDGPVGLIDMGAHDVLTVWQKAPTPFDPHAVTEVPSDETDAYVCECGNTALSDGFYAVDPEGFWCEPIVDWDGLYACADCGRRLRTI